MFRFFDNLPDEMTLQIFSETSRQEQAKLTKTSKKFNEIANHESSKLFKYKSGNFLVKVGNVCLVVREIEKNTYELFTTHNGNQVINSGKIIKQKTFDELIETEGTFSLIGKLKISGLNSSICARALELEHNRITSNDILTSFKSNPENLVIQIGHTAFVIEKIAEDSYELFTIQNGQIASMLNTTQATKKHFDKYFERAKEGLIYLIEELKNDGVSCCKHASLLEEALLEENKRRHNGKCTV